MTECRSCFKNIRFENLPKKGLSIYSATTYRFQLFTRLFYRFIVLLPSTIVLYGHVRFATLRLYFNDRRINGATLLVEQTNGIT